MMLLRRRKMAKIIGGNTIWDVGYIKWILISHAKKRKIGCRIRVGASKKIWSGACNEVVAGYDRNQYCLFLNSVVSQIICWKDNSIFLEEIKVSTFRSSQKFEESNSSNWITPHGPSGTHAGKNAENDECQSQQCNMAGQIYRVVMNIRVDGMRNRWFKPCKSMDENLTGCLQRYGIPEYGRN
jgi:hypothetical protein